MRKILEVGLNDLTESAKSLPYDQIRIEELCARAFQEALICDVVEFYAGGKVYTLKCR